MADMHFQLFCLTKFIVEVKFSNQKLFYPFSLRRHGNFKYSFQLPQKQANDCGGWQIKGHLSKFYYQLQNLYIFIIQHRVILLVNYDRVKQTVNEYQAYLPMYGMLG